MNLSKTLKEKRQELNLKQSELAEKAGITLSAISNYEQGLREPKLNVLIKIADIFDMTLDELVGRERLEGNSQPVVDIHDHEEEELLKEYRQLSTDDKEKIKAIIKTLAEMPGSAKGEEETAG